MLWRIDRFGAHGVLGRCLGYGEITRMLTAQDIVTYFRERKKSIDWAVWARSNPDKDAVLAHAAKCAIDLGML